MDFVQLWKIVENDLKPKLEKSSGLAIFARERAKFEGWLKVEYCDSLSKFTNDVAPERNRIDVTFENWAIELKTVNTNYRITNVKNKHRPITRNVDDVLKDIEKLKVSNHVNKAYPFRCFSRKT